MATTPSYLRDLESVLRKHLPKDSDQRITDHMVAKWTSQIAEATEVIFSWDHEHGRKLKASWSAGGSVLASMAQPEGRAASLREFVDDWQHCRRTHQLPATVVKVSEENDSSSRP
jgi:hypothetical protein